LRETFFVPRNDKTKKGEIPMLSSYHGQLPRVSPTVRAAESADLVGDITLDAGVSVWFGAVVRGDIVPVQVGAKTNIQDNAVLHAGDGHPLTVGESVTIGHAAIVHGCTVGDRCLIGMGAILLNGCVIGEDSLVAAGALVTQGKVIPPRSLVMGSPARVVRTLTQEEADRHVVSAEHYLALAEEELPLVKSVKEGAAP